MRFILLLDAAGAEFVKARITSKYIVAAAHGRLLRFKPITITPVEVIEEKDHARRAAGGFALLGPLGAALGVLTGKGSQVLFELVESDGTVRKGVVAQADYPTLRRAIERIQKYKPGEAFTNLMVTLAFLALLAVCVAATGPLGFLIGTVVWFAAHPLVRRLGRRSVAA